MKKRFLIWYWSSSGGGGSIFASNLAQRLAQHWGSDAIRLSLHADDPTVASLKDAPFEILLADIVSNRRAPFATLRGLARSAGVLREHARNVDCVVVPMNFAVAAPLAVELQQPIVYFAHDPVPHPGDYAQFWQRATQAVLLRRSTCVVTLSSYSANLLTRAGHLRAKTRTVSLNAVIEPSDGSPGSVDRRPLNFVCAGRMIAYKGLDLLAEALPNIGTRGDWRLLIAGEGPALDDAMMQRLQLPQVEIRNGWMREDQLRAMIAEADVLIAPYTSATQSGVVAQALALGKPCVVTPVGALPEQINGGEAGWIATTASSQAFAHALNATLDERTTYAEKASKAHAIARAAWSRSPWSWLETLQTKKTKVRRL